MTVIETNDITITKLFHKHIVPVKNNGYTGKRGKQKIKIKVFILVCIKKKNI